MPVHGESITPLFSVKQGETQTSVIGVTEKPSSQTRTCLVAAEQPFTDPAVFERPVRLRLCSQISFFLLFLFLLIRTEFRGSIATSGTDILLPYPVGLFFRLDPLVSLANALTGHGLYQGLLVSLVILIPTMFLGRFFCGWICPLGSIHHFLGGLKSERKRGKQLLESNRYKRWQTTKYYLLIAVLISALLGTGVVGWLDPFSFLVRSLGLSVLPTTNYAFQASLRWLEHSPMGLVQTVASILHLVLGAVFLNFKQPYIRQGVWLGILFIFVLAINFRVTRFWCRAICPPWRFAGNCLSLVCVGIGQESGTLQ